MVNVFTFYGKTNSSKSNQTGPVDSAFAEETIGFLLKFSNFRKKSLRIIFMNALCKYFETYKTLQVV